MWSRRGWLGGACALVFGEPLPAHAAFGDIPPLKSLSPYPLGVAVRASDLRDPTWTTLATTHFSRLTPEWEMKMEYLLRDDGQLQFDRADQFVAFAQKNGMAMHGHTLIWYDQPGGSSFARLAGKPDAFLNAYVTYITAVMGRYKGQIGGWDVVNEPVWDDGRGLRPCLWQKVLGDDYIGLALEAAHRADPQALLFINDYNLELTPAKRRTFLKMCEGLLRDGAPLHGIGTQTHIDSGLPPGALIDAIRDLASLGLKVHVSELDISVREAHPANIVAPRLHQIALIEALLKVYGDLPARQRYGVTLWGLRDSDSFLNRQQTALLPDEPVLFDKAGRPKPMAQTFAKGLRN